jgi:myo-inositol-1-phosphate synthase
MKTEKLGVCIAGLNGAVASTLVAGVALIENRLAEPLGLVSEPFAKSHRLARLRDLVFGGWDPVGESILQSVRRHRVIDDHRLKPIGRVVSGVKAWPAARSQAAAVRDIASFKRRHRLDRVVVLNLTPTAAHAASKLYAAAANRAGSGFVNFTPNQCNESKLTAIPYAGRDGKTGQTWFKSVLAPALQARGLRISGWYSTNLLGNEDGKIVGHPTKGRAKIRDKSKLLGEMLGYDPFHKVQINYYPPRGDNKESWDNIDFEGFLGLPMQIKVNQLYRDSVLAAPMCIDLVRFIDLAARHGETGAQTWLSYYFKSPYATRIHAADRQIAMLMDFLNHR